MGYDQHTGDHATAAVNDSVPRRCEKNSFLHVSAPTNRETAHRTAQKLQASELKLPI